MDIGTTTSTCSRCSRRPHSRTFFPVRSALIDRKVWTSTKFSSSSRPSTTRRCWSPRSTRRRILSRPGHEDGGGVPRGVVGGVPIRRPERRVRQTDAAARAAGRRSPSARGQALRAFRHHGRGGVRGRLVFDDRAGARRCAAGMEFGGHGDRHIPLSVPLGERSRCARSTVRCWRWTRSASGGGNSRTVTSKVTMTRPACNCCATAVRLTSRPRTDLARPVSGRPAHASPISPPMTFRPMATRRPTRGPNRSCLTSECAR